MRTYEFCVIATGLDPEDDDLDRLFFDCGCDDATVSFQGGRIVIDFARQAESRPAAIMSALIDVRKTGAVIVGAE